VLCEDNQLLKLCIDALYESEYVASDYLNVISRSFSIWR